MRRAEDSNPKPEGSTDFRDQGIPMNTLPSIFADEVRFELTRLLQPNGLANRPLNHLGIHPLAVIEGFEPS